MLVWKENDRAIMAFNSMQDIENGKAELTEIVSEWIIAATKTNREHKLGKSVSSVLHRHICGYSKFGSPH